MFKESIFVRGVGIIPFTTPSKPPARAWMLVKVKRPLDTLSTILDTRETTEVRKAVVIHNEETAKEVYNELRAVSLDKAEWLVVKKLLKLGEYNVYINYAANYGRFAPVEDDRRAWGEDVFVDEDDKEIFTHEEAECILRKLFPPRWVVTYNSGEDAFHMRELTMGNWQGGMFPHETYCGNWKTKEEAEAYISAQK